MSTLNAKFYRPHELNPTGVDDLYRLYERYYTAVTKARFQQDLDEKDRVLCLYDGEYLAGFTTIKHVPFKHHGKACMALFSGDTIVDHHYWGQQLLALAWCHHAGRLKARAPEVPLYWFLIVKGHRTYRLMTLFSRRCYPHWRHSTPSDIAHLMHRLARQRYGSNYDEQKGIVRFHRSQGHLRARWAHIDDARRGKPDVAFFMHKNPGYARGDELVCLTELCAENMRSHARRAFVGEWQP